MGASVPETRSAYRVISYFGDILLDPKLAFSKRRPRLEVLVLGLTTVLALIFGASFPFYKSALAATYHGNVLTTVAVIYGFGSILASYLVWTIYAAALFGIVRYLRAKVTFSDVVSVVLSAAVVIALSGVVNVAILWIIVPSGGVSNLTQQHVIPNLNSLLHATGWLGGALKSLSPFSVWFFVLVGIGAEQRLNLSKRRAVLAAVLLAAIGVSISGAMSGA